MRVRGAISTRYSGASGCKTGAVRVHVLERSQRVEVPTERAFAFYGDALNLEPLTPPWLHFEVTTPGEIDDGGGHPARLQAEAARHPDPLADPDRDLGSRQARFVDTQAKGPYSLWEHTHTFEPDGEGATVIHDRVRYAIPFGPLGALAERLFVRRDLRRIFDYRAAAVAERLGG